MRSKKAACAAPHDVSVTGYNHMPFVDRFTPSLTRVHIPHKEFGIKSAELLLERIENPSIRPRTIRLRPPLGHRPLDACARHARNAGRS